MLVLTGGLLRLSVDQSYPWQHSRACGVLGCPTVPGTEQLSVKWGNYVCTLKLRNPAQTCLFGFRSLCLELSV